MCLEMVQIVLHYVLSERIGAWLGHIEKIQNMLPFVAAEKHTKYMACLPLYRKEMRDLPQTHPEVHNEVIDGNFTIQLKQGKANDVWSDPASEQIYHKEGKTTFLKGVTQNNAARKSIPRQQAWVLKCRVISACFKFFLGGRGWQGRRTSHVPPSLPPLLISKAKFKIFVTLPS